MKEELDALSKNHTWDLVTLPPLKNLWLVVSGPSRLRPLGNLWLVVSGSIKLRLALMGPLSTTNLVLL